MSAEKLREAARLMRERAEAIPPEGLSDWWFDAEASDLMHLRKHDREQIATFGHPVVALAVADWLEGQAMSAANLEQVLGASESQIANLLCDALAVARTYLNEATS